MEEASNLSTFDLYSDLIEDNVKQKEYSYNELESNYKNVLEELNVTRGALTELTAKSNTLQEENVNLKKNFSSLLLTAKAELKRKSDEILRLRCCLENRNRRLNRTRNPRRSLDQLSRSQDFDSRTGDTFDRVVSSKSSIRDLGFSKYRLGKDEQKGVRRETKSDKTKAVKSSVSKHTAKDRTTKETLKVSEPKDKQNDLRASLHSKDIAEFVSSTRQISSKDHENSPNKTVTQNSERKQSPKTMDHRHRQRDRKIDVSRGRLEGKLVKSQQKHENIHRDKIHREKEYLKNGSLEKENVSCSNSKVESRKRRHGSESQPSSKRPKSVVSPVTSSREKGSSLRKYIQTSPITASTSETQKMSNKNSETHHKIAKDITDQEKIRKEISIAEKTSLKDKHDDSVRAESVDSKLGVMPSLKQCAVRKSVKDRLSLPKKSTGENILKEPFSLYNLCKSKAPVAGSSDMAKCIITRCDVNNTTEAKDIVPKEEPSISKSQPNENKTVLANVAGPDSLKQANLETNNNMNQVISSVEPDMIKDKSIAVKEYFNDTFSKTDIPVCCITIESACPAQSKSCISVESSEGVKSNVFDSDSCLSVMSSVVDSASCSSIGMSCQHATQGQGSVCTVTSTTLWKCFNGVTTWVQSEEVVGGVKKYRLRPSSSKESVTTTCTSSRESLLSSPCVAPKKAAIICDGISKTPSPVNNYKESTSKQFSMPSSSKESVSTLTPSQESLLSSPEVTHKKAVINSDFGDLQSTSQVKNCQETISKASGMPIEFLSRSPFKTPSNATSMDRIAESDDCHPSQSIESVGEKSFACSLITTSGIEIYSQSSDIDLGKKQLTEEPKSIQKSNISDLKLTDNKEIYRKEKDKKSSTKKNVKIEHKKNTYGLSPRNSVDGKRRHRREHTSSKPCSRYSPRKARKSPSYSKSSPNPPKDCFEEASESLMSIPDDVYVFIGEESPSVQPIDNFDKIDSQIDKTVSDVTVGTDVPFCDSSTQVSDTAAITDQIKGEICCVTEEISSENVAIDNWKDNSENDTEVSIPIIYFPSSNNSSANMFSGAEKRNLCDIVSKIEGGVGSMQSDKACEEDKDSMEEGEITSDSDGDYTPDVQKPEPKSLTPLSLEPLPTNDLRLKLKSRQHKVSPQKTISRKRRRSTTEHQRRHTPDREVRPLHTRHPSPTHHRQDSPRDKSKRLHHSPADRRRSRSCSSDRSAHSHHSNKSGKDAHGKTCSNPRPSPNRHRHEKLRSPSRASDRHRGVGPRESADHRRARKCTGRQAHERRLTSPRHHSSPLRQEPTNRRQRCHKKSTSDRDRGCEQSDSRKNAESSRRSPSEDNSECSCCRDSNQRSSKTPSDSQLSPDTKHIKRERRLSGHHKSKNVRSNNKRESVQSETKSNNPDLTTKQPLKISNEKDFTGSFKSDSCRDLKKRKD